MMLRSTFPILFAAALWSSGSAAQTTSGMILGSVSDPSRARVPAADVTATSRDTNRMFATRTNADGVFVLAQIPAGRYDVRVRKPGFKTLLRTDLELHVDDRLRIDVTMELGASTETVRISGNPPALQTENSGTGTVIGSRQIVDLPLLERDFLD